MKTDASWDDDSQCYEYQYRFDNHEFFSRLGDVDFSNKRVVEIGCGHGALCISVAEKGAKQVVGLDIYDRLIDFAQANLLRFPEFVSRVSYINRQFEKLDGEFDVIISKDTFEHISDLPGLMANIQSKLTCGGVLAVGFAPLYYSPNGDHRRFLESASIPWLPVIVPEVILLRLASWVKKKKISSVNDLGLNKITPKQFRAIIQSQGWKVVSMKYNQGDKVGLRLMSLLRRIPILEKYFTVSIYAVLQPA